MQKTIRTPIVQPALFLVKIISSSDTHIPQRAANKNPQAAGFSTPHKSCRITHRMQKIFASKRCLPSARNQEISATARTRINVKTNASCMDACTENNARPPAFAVFHWLISILIHACAPVQPPRKAPVKTRSTIHGSPAIAVTNRILSLMISARTQHKIPAPAVRIHTGSADNCPFQLSLMTRKVPPVRRSARNVIHMIFLYLF